MIPPLPPAFVTRMRDLLDDEAEAFLASYAGPACAGLRVNPAKIEPAVFAPASPWSLTPVPWCPTGFLIDNEARPGRHPWHAAGLYYLQEPSAMVVAEALAIRPGHLVLDLAAAPGGKATHLAALLGGEGLLVANEFVRARIKPLGENLERWGARNVVLLNDEPARIAAGLGPVFDRVLLDAPCSGEGLFRKTPAARTEWSSDHVAGSAIRQSSLLATAARSVRPGGLLLYSTCTFNPTENERVIAAFLATHPGWDVADIPHPPSVDPGRPDWADPPDPRLARAARLWPHRARAEGHFLALLRAPGDERPDSPMPGDLHRPPSQSPDPAALLSWRAFAAATLTASLPEERLVATGSRLTLRPAVDLDFGSLAVVRNGLWLGDCRPGRFEPSHALALALHAGDAANRLDLNEEHAARYLSGHTLEAPGPPGWVLVTVGDHPLGWGRRTATTVKNHYPKGLRRRLG